MSKNNENGKVINWVPKDKNLFKGLDTYRAEEEAIDYIVRNALKPKDN